MARIISISKSVAILLCLLSSSAAASSTTIIDATGALDRSTNIPSSTGNNGIVAVLTSPGTPSFFDSSDGGVTLMSTNNGITVLSSPGATLSGISSLARGNGAAAASIVSGSLILSGVTESDLEYGLDDTRHGHTLSQIFKASIEDSADDESIQPKSLFLVAPAGAEIDEDEVKADLLAIFETVKAEVGGQSTFDDLFALQIESVESEADAEKLMAKAAEAASSTKSINNISSAIASAYTKASASSAATSAASTSTSATAAILACDNSFARQSRTARAKLSSWKSRTSRGLTVDSFGSAAAQLMKRTMESYDRDTMTAIAAPAAAGSAAGGAASYRLEMRSKLQSKIESTIRDLFKVQVGILEKNTLKKFNSMLLRKHGKDNDGTEAFYNDNAAAVRTAAFTFESSVNELQIPSLSLTKVAAMQEINTKLNTALLDFPDSPAARLKNMKAVSRAVDKQKQPTERSLDFGLDLVAMIRPDGFGNLQGFAGYQLGGNNLIVGVHNDADAPDVISQFGGKRPPFIRVQPKLKVDVEL